MKDEHRLLLAFALSFLVLLAFQWYYARSYRPPQPSSPAPGQGAQAQQAPQNRAEVRQEGTQAPPGGEQIPELPQRAFFLERAGSTYAFALSNSTLKSWVLPRYHLTLDPHSPAVNLCAPENGCLAWGFLGKEGELYPLTAAKEEGGGIVYAYATPQGSARVRIVPQEPYELLFTFEVTGEARVHPYLRLFPLSGEEDLPRNLALKYHRYGELKTLKGKALEEKLFLETDLDYLLYDGKYFATGLLFPPREGIGVAGEPPLHSLLLRLPLLSQESPTAEVRFLGVPKEFKLLRSLHSELDRILDFGWSGFLGRPLAALLHFFYGIFHNYGIAIILLTILVRLLLYPLTYKSFRSMQDLARLRPRIEEIQKKYKKDPQRLQEELLKLYRSEKVNPFSGCLPLILQLPVFIALYNVLLVSVELRHAHFFLWIRDLSAPDTLFALPLFGFSLPFRPLPLAMGITTYLQQRLTPTPQSLDPAQQVMMNIMPIFLTVISYGFPSGLVLYWFVSNLFSIAQQWWLQRNLKKIAGEEKG